MRAFLKFNRKLRNLLQLQSFHLIHVSRFWQATRAFHVILIKFIFRLSVNEEAATKCKLFYHCEKRSIHS